MGSDVNVSSAGRRWMREGAFVAALVGGMLSARSSLADHYQIPSGSMMPTIQVGDRVVVNKVAYGLRLPFSDVKLFGFAGPARGEVAVLRSPENEDTLIKRVVAVPGDLVVVRGGRVWIDGRPVPIEGDEIRALERIGASGHPISFDDGGGPDFGPMRLPADQYLVMGDNRGNSRDGRSFGLVDRKAFLGRAVAVFWSDGGPAWRGL
jgi:signal peptidase I